MSSSLRQEQLLVERLKTGQRAAFAELYDRYHRALFTVLVEVTQSTHDAENLLQDVFVKIWRNITRYEPEKGRLYTWLIVIARRIALDFVRSQYFSTRNKIQNSDSAVSIESPAPEMARLEYIGLESALAALDRPLREVIDLQYFKGYTQQEVSDETGIPLGTVKTRTRAALLILRSTLENEHV